MKVKMENNKELLKQELERFIDKRKEKQELLDMFKKNEAIQREEKEEWERTNNAKKDEAEKNGNSDNFHKLLMEQIALSDTLQKTQEEIGGISSEIEEKLK